MSFWRTLFAWWILITLSIFGVSAATDALSQLRTGGIAGAVLGTHLALAILVAAMMLVPLSAAQRLHDKLAQHPRAQRAFPPAVAAISMFAVTWYTCAPFRQRHWVAHVVVVLMATAAASGCVWVVRARAEPPALRPVACAIVAAAVMGLDAMLPSSTNFEFHLALHLLAPLAVACALDPFRERIHRRAAPAHLLALPALLASAALFLRSVDGIFPAWRSSSLPTTHHLSILTHMLRKTIDLDRDGYSAIAWGTDCDDLDPAIHPLAVDPPGGGDRNCNGVDPPETPTDADRGLTEPRGKQALPSGAVDLTILLTVDALRADCLGEELMPATLELGRRGIVFDSMYALGSATLWSVPLMLMADERSEVLPAQFRSAGVAVSAFAGGNDNINYDALGFPGLSDKYGSCEAIVDAALEKIRSVGTAPHFVWLYCFEPHEPYQLNPAHEHKSAPGCGGANPSKHTRAYQSEVAAVDAALGKLVAGLTGAGRMERTALIVTGDHGELFGEHGAYHHARTAWQPVLRVPAVFVAPGVPPVHYAHLATHRDIPATLLGAMGLAEPSLRAESFGRSWLRIPAALDHPIHTFTVSRSAYWASSVENNFPLGIITDGRYKLVQSYEERTFELYDLGSDPDERINLHARDPERVERMRRQLALYGDLDHYPANSPLRWLRR